MQWLNKVFYKAGMILYGTVFGTAYEGLRPFAASMSTVAPWDTTPSCPGGRSQERGEAQTIGYQGKFSVGGKSKEGIVNY